jgi:hypothetical protein
MGQGLLLLVPGTETVKWCPSSMTVVDWERCRGSPVVVMTKGYWCRMSRCRVAAKKMKPGISFVSDVPNSGGGFVSSAFPSFHSLATPSLPS